MAEAALARQPREQCTLSLNGNIWFGNWVDRQELQNINYSRLWNRRTTPYSDLEHYPDLEHPIRI